jgi:carbon-monoxide dehydrogenase large subunit
MVIAERFTGTAVRRKEDPRILSGRGNYVADIELPGMLHATFLRSPFAHARIRHIDASEARRAPGVVAVYTGEDLAPFVDIGQVGIVAKFNVPGPSFPIIAIDKVRLVGDLVALVVAETRALAEDACELIDVDYDELPAIASAERAFDPNAPLIFDDAAGNIAGGPNTVSHGDVDGAFAKGDRTLRVTLRQHRHQNVPMETRGGVFSYDRDTDELTVWIGCQGVHNVRDTLADRTRIPAENIRVRTGDVGGSFGLKIGAYREDVACAVAAKQLGRPVKWIEDRSEHMAASGHAREEHFDVEVSFTDEGDILGLAVEMTMDCGAYPGIGSMLPVLIGSLVPGPYRVEALRFSFKSAITNKATYIAYRGPWAAETFVRERVVDLIARELGREPLDIRLRNVVTRGVPPLSMVTGRPLTGVTIKESLEKLAEVIDLPTFRKRQSDARANGVYLGLGMASYIEAAPGPKAGDNAVGREEIRMRLDDDGTVVVLTGQMPHGQSHETTLAQIAADQFGVSFDAVRVVAGDTADSPEGSTGGSRAATMAGGATLTAARALRAKVLDVASHLLEARVDDLVIDDAGVAVRGVPTSAIPLAEIATAAKTGRVPDDVAGDIEVSLVYDGGQGGWSGGTHCCIVEVDIATGLVRIERYLVIEDCGELINPAIVDGQVRGGVAQGVGAVLLEKSTYDDNGQFLATTFMDYLLPTSIDVPRIEIVHLETVPLDSDVNFRGVGEGGMIVTPAALCNAIEDALAPFGVTLTEQHLPPARILELIGAIEPE